MTRRWDDLVGWKQDFEMKLSPHHCAPASPRLIILGLGNPLLGDDAVGWRVAQACAKTLAASAEIDCHAGGGLSLMERLVGYDRAILIDALTTGNHPVGTVQVRSLSELTDPAAGHLMSSHDTSLQTALDAGRAMGVDVPKRVTVVAIEAERVYDFTEGLSPQVAAAIPHAVELVTQVLEAWDSDAKISRSEDQRDLPDWAQ